MQRGARHSGGYTLIELMIGLGILTLVVLESLAAFVTQQRTYHAQERVVAAQQDAKLSADMMRSDVRMAGFLVPAFAGISSRDGGTTDADVLCTSDPDALDDGKIADATDRFDRAVISSAVGAGASSVSINTGHADVDIDGNDDFVVDQGIIISDGSASHCAYVTSVSSTSIGFAPPSPSGFTVSASSGRAVPATIYELTGSGLERNKELLTSQVEDLQVEFGLDANSDGVIAGSEFPIDDISGANTNQIRVVRLSVLTRTRSEDPAISGAGRQKVANRDASGTADAYRRRLVIFRAAPRNML
ncbi:MAG: PilW family protein [Deltaproteobacteria bacterium]|nr:PilW family protein [Deltaproteobacteria bacterium]MBW2363280.1 PilW family protein [Deltaproteobacteria bacterium]